MNVRVCHGRRAFEELVPFGSEKNKCPFGLDIACQDCRFYVELEGEKMHA